ncbi:T9SS type A sorting domain-containing protein, partial [candidate division WOR-3 bacterium]|nr:T9SS type A sorting domain-containing protein [candidate division WOR-3 bacterium]
IDANGDTIWSKTYGGANSDGGCCVQKTSDSGYVIVGRTLSFGAGYVDVWFLKTDSLGDTLWTKTYGTSNEDWGYFGQQTMDGGYIITGYQMFSPGEGDVWLIKTDESGNVLWTNTFGGSNYDEARSVRQTPDKGYIICGTDNFNTSNSELYLIKTDSLGSEEWSKTYGGALMDYGLGIALTSDGGYIAVGKKTISGVAGQAYLVRVTSNGDTLWTKVFGGTAEDYAHSVQETSDSGFIIAGSIGIPTNHYGYLIKTEPSGDSLWSKTYGGSPRNHNFFSVQETNDGGYICVGSISGDYDVYAVKTDTNGNVGIKEDMETRKEKQNAGLFASPNPFVSFTTVPGFEREKFLVYDIQGRLIEKYPGNRIGEDLCAGVYFLKFAGRDSKLVRVVKIQ